MTKMFKMAILLGAAPLLVAATGPADEAAAAAAAEKMQAEKDGPNVMVCKKFPPPVGTRLRARQICKTQGEWDLLERDQWETMDRVQRKPYQAQ